MKKTVIVCDMCEAEMKPGAAGIYLSGKGAAITRYSVAGVAVRDGSKPFRMPEAEHEATICWGCVVKHFGPNDSMVR